MGIIRVIKSNELAGGEGNEPIYPVTSVRAIYDLNNRQLDSIIEEQNQGIEWTKTLAENLKDNVNTAESNIKNLTSTYNILQSNVNTIISDVDTLKVTVEEKNNQNNYIVAKVTVGDSVTRGLPENVNNNLECYSPIKDPSCIPSQGATSYIQNIKDGEILIPTKSGEYIIDNQTLEVKECSLIQKQGNNFVVISLGIPFIPIPTSIDSGKTLKVAEDNSLYWG